MEEGPAIALPGEQGTKGTRAMLSSLAEFVLNRVRERGEGCCRAVRWDSPEWHVVASYAAAVSRRCYDLANSIYYEIWLVILDTVPTLLCNDLLSVLRAVR